jgi:aminobenzoyl-glutamate utilization protein B
METAFIAEYGRGKPIIGILGEYDALPSLSQKAAQNRQEALVRGGAGHGCGHNALGAGAFAAAVAVKEHLRIHDAGGTVRFYGCPAEESGWGKMFLAREKLFDDLDAAVTWHPYFMNTVQGWGGLAVVCVDFHFFGTSAHAAATPHLGRSALDACELMSVGVNYLREHVLPSVRMHYAYQDTGGESPNVVQNRACVKYYIRAPRMRQALEITERVKAVAQGAAMMTGTTVDIDLCAGIYDFVPNDTLGSIFDQALHDVGAPRFDEDDRALARCFQDSFSPEDIATSRDLLAEVYPDSEHSGDSHLLETIAPYRRLAYSGMSSTDVGDVSYATPTVQLNIACYAVGTPGHSWQLTAQSASPLADKGMLCAAEVMAIGVIRLMEHPQVLHAAHEEYLKATGGNYTPLEIRETLPPAASL